MLTLLGTAALGPLRATWCKGRDPTCAGAEIVVGHVLIPHPMSAQAMGMAEHIDAHLSGHGGLQGSFLQEVLLGGPFLLWVQLT